ncbi:MAG: hypothetical protein C0505_09400 [Leptothrix sp. (in: Bacteria)]|nr:hypothetical protein [Leptothrix sp. (in: b-proteobacteria)]
MMGQPLDFPISVRLAPDETLTPSCLAAEVTVGDRRLAAAAVSTVLEMTGTQSARIRVRTSLSVDEPVVGVLLTANCGTVRMSRRFVVLADPPLQSAAPQPVSAFVPALAATPVDVPPEAVARADAPAASAEAAPANTSKAAVSARAQTPSAAPRYAAAGTRATAKAPPPRDVRRAERRKVARRTESARPAQRKVAAAAAAVPMPTPRLRLEAAEPAPDAQATVAEALATVAQAASAARAAASAAAQSAARIATLERELGDLRKETASSRETTAMLRDRLISAERSSRWTWPLLALVLLLTSLAAWMSWRLNDAERRRQRGWQAPAAPAPGPASELTPSRLPTAPIPFVTSELKLPASAPPPRPRHAWPAPAPADTRPPPDDARATDVSKPPAPPPPREPEAPMQRTEPLPPQSAIDLAAARDVSIEELIDLEQQAEFFVVLGQDDAAIDLLVEHLRHTGGGSPLPYLKLLEIYHRRAEREHYERTRTRFNHRFNAYAPEWGIDLQAGRSLESYPGVVPRLQQVWARPLDAMAELEALLFRKSRGELFDLPAYREVLFLYSLARDLLDREAVATGGVDLLLPLAHGGASSSTSPTPVRTPAPPAAGVGSAALDFDLTAETGPATSLFGPLDDTPDRPSRR